MSRFNSSGPRTEELGKSSIRKDTLRKASFLLNFLKPYRAKFILALILLGAGSGVSLLFPWLLGAMVDLVSGTKSSKSLFFKDLNTLIFFIGTLLALSALMSFFRIMWFAQVGEKSLADIRSVVFAHTLKLKKDFFDQNSTGGLLSRINNDLSQIQDTLSTFLANLIRQIIVLIAGISVILINNTHLALLMLAVIPPVVLFALFFGRKIRKISRQTQDELAEANEVAEESFSGLVHVKSYTRESYESKRYQTALLKVVDLAVLNSKYRGAFAASVVFLMFSAILAVLWYGFNLIQKGEMTLGELNSFIFYGMFIAGSMAGFAENYNQLLKTLGATERIFEILETPEEKGGNQPYAGGRGSIRLAGVTFSYSTRPEVQVLNEVSMNLGAGQKLALVGESGAGKSTIASLLLRLYDPNSGSIFLDQTDLRDYNIRELRSLIAYVPQDVQLFSGTIRDNIRYGKEEATEEDLIEAARKSYSIGFIEKLPNGFDTLVGEKGLQLSSGQRQRIAIARAFLKDPLVLILDEATSALDAESEAQVQKAIEEIMKNRTSVIIAHRLSTIRFADQIAVMQSGQILETGTHESLMSTKNSAYSRLVSLQFQA